MKLVGLFAMAAIGIGMFFFRMSENDMAMAQSGTRTQRGSGTRPQSESRRSPRSQAPATTFEQKFWNYLTKAQYQNWAPGPGQSDDFYEGQSPHGKWLKLYLNRSAAGNPRNPPVGSVIVKENYGPDKKTLMAVTVMYRSKGYNPEAGDWYWVKYNPNGTVAKMSTEKGDMPIAGRAKGCIECHAGSLGDDYSFFNDNLAE